MTKVIGLNEAPAPANVQAFVTSGGTLTQPATYYYKVVASGYQDFYWSPNCWLSVPSDEVSITTNSTNRKAIIHGDDVTGTGSVLAQDYILYRSLSVSGDYNIVNSSGVAKNNVAAPDGFRSNHWNSVRVDNAVTYRRYQMTTSAIASLVPNETITGATSGATALVLTNPAGGTTFKVWTITGTFSSGESLNGSVSGLGVGTFTSLSARDGFVLVDQVATGSRFPYYEEGGPVITVAGGTESDPVTMQDIYDYLISIGKDYCIDGISLFPTGQYINTAGNDICNMWRLRASISSNDTTGWFKLGGGEVVSWCGLKHNFRNNVILGEKDTNGLTTNGCAIVGAWHLAFYNGFAYGAGSLQCNSSMLGMRYLPKSGMATIGNCSVDPYYQASQNWEVNDSIILSSGRLNNTCQIYNSRLMLSGEIGGSANSAGWQTENAQFNAIISNPTNSGDSTFPNFIVNHVTSPDFRPRSYGGSNQTITYHLTSPVLKRGEPVMQAQSALSATNWDCHILIDKKINLKVLDEDENALENVKITVQDKNDKDCLFEETATIFSTTVTTRTDTSITTNVLGLEVGSYYRIGNEIIKITGYTGGTTFTIDRAQFGTTAGIYGSWRTYFYKMNEYLETDSNGNTDFLVTSDKYNGYAINPTAVLNKIDTLSKESQSPFTLTLSKAGYETLIIKGNINEDLNCKYTLKKQIPVMIGENGEGYVKADPTNSTVNRGLLLQ
jgi:hypothetical protein